MTTPRLGAVQQSRFVRTLQLLDIPRYVWYCFEYDVIN